MSARAIRALRGDDGGIPVANNNNNNASSDDEQESETEEIIRPASVFATLLDEDSSSSSSSSDDDDHDDGGDSVNDLIDEKVEPVEEGKKYQFDGVKKGLEEDNGSDESVTDEQEDNLDALLSEFQKEDAETAKGISESTQSSPGWGSHLFSSFNEKDLDIDYSMRESLMGNMNNAPAPAQQTKGRHQKKKRQVLLFGPARDGWARPPHYVAGGIGMTSYDRDPRELPWPYNSIDLAEGYGEADRWFTFMHSGSYQKDLQDYEHIQQSGDLNALFLFVAHHPFVVEALLQLVTVLYQTNHSHEGLSLLRRCLWIYERSSLPAFMRELDGTTLMNFDEEENATYFNALFRLAKVSNVAGLPRTAMAVSRFILSLDPLRDPMGVLLAIDHYALASNLELYDQWLVNFVENEAIRIRYRDNDTMTSYDCKLLDLPNWAFSYALACFRLRDANNHTEDVDSKANRAIRDAMNRFPRVVGLLLEKNEVDTTGRSFCRDWITVLNYSTDREKRLRNEWYGSGSGIDTIALSATLQSCDLIIGIFVKQNAKLWGDSEVLQWVYDNMEQLKTVDFQNPGPPSPALMRYAGCVPSDYDNKFEQLPQDANLVDPGLIAQAMVVDPNRPRFLRGMDRGAQVGAHRIADGMAVPRPAAILGRPVHVVNPDWPLIEVFWRSFLPWNTVEGV